MSAHRYTDCRIDCDHEGCGKNEFGGNLNVMYPTAAETRMVLKSRGWLVGVPGEHGSRRDFCPDHRPDVLAEKDGDPR